MWRLLGCTLSLFVASQLGSWCVLASAAEPDAGVQIEVLFKPLECTQKSKRGDLLNVHYDGYLASDGSQFYCRWVGLKKSTCIWAETLFMHYYQH